MKESKIKKLELCLLLEWTRIDMNREWWERILQLRMSEMKVNKLLIGFGLGFCCPTELIFEDSIDCRSKSRDQQQTNTNVHPQRKKKKKERKEECLVENRRYSCYLSTSSLLSKSKKSKKERKN
jgi:hypothetical protein